MRTVTLEIASHDAVSRRFRSALAGKTQGTRLSFESPALLIKVLSGRRWDLLKAMTGAGPMTIREAARRMERDVKAVHGDVQTLLNADLLRKTGAGKIVFPYDVVRVDFTLRGSMCGGRVRDENPCQNSDKRPPDLAHFDPPWEILAHCGA